MIALILALLIDPPPTTQVQTSPSNASAATVTAPLREVVYRFSYNTTIEQTYRDYATVAPDANQTGGGYDGKLVVDVMQAEADGLLLHVTETTNALNDTKPTVADVVVFTDGTLKIIGGEYDRDMTMLLPYFGQNCFGNNTLQQGNQWIVNSAAPDGSPITSTYTVASVNGDEATVTEASLPKAGTEGSKSIRVDTKVIYKATLLVPISISIVMRGTNQDSMSENKQQDVYHFDRVSDTRDTAPSP